MSGPKIQWFFVPLEGGVAVSRERMAALARELFTMELCWDAPGGAPERLRPGVSVRTWLRPGSLVGVVLERTPKGLAIGIRPGGSPSDWGLALCLAVGLAREENALIRTDQGQVIAPDLLLAQATPELLWKRWVDATKQLFFFVRDEKETVVLDGLRRLHVGVQVVGTCVNSKDPARTLLRVLNRSAHLIGLEPFEEALRTLNEGGWHSVALAPGRQVILRDPEFLELQGAPAGTFLPLESLVQAYGRPLEQLDEVTFAFPGLAPDKWQAFLGRAQPHLVRK